MILTPDNEYAAVLDACVLIPMPLCDTLLRLAEEPATYRPLWSREILGEVSRGLQNKLKKTEEQAKRRINRMERAFPEANVAYPEDFLKAFECVPDRDDRHVLAAAVHGHAYAIVTSNVKHFPDDCLSRYGILCQTPDDFLIHQYTLCPDSVLEKLDTQAANIAQDRLTLIKKLQRITPQFSDIIAQRS